METCKEIECSSAKELLDQLSPRSEYFEQSDPRDWIFRGHGDAAWKLIPSAFRDPSRLFFIPSTTPLWANWTTRNQIQAEAATLLRFIAEADDAGLPVPGVLSDLREELDRPFQEPWYEDVMREGLIKWLPNVLWPVAALAQHYGLATRFLDWTRSPAIAAYFAAVDSFDQPVNTSMAVWAFSTGSDAARRGMTGSTESTVAVVPAPYASNPNLRAQEGVHIAPLIWSGHWTGPAERPDFSSYFERVMAFSQTFGYAALLKFTLAGSEAPALLRYLAKENVTAARLFPGYLGAAKSVLNSKLSR